MFLTKHLDLDDVYSSLEPYFRIAFLFGTKPVDRTKNAYTKSYFRIVLSVVLLAVGVALVWYSSSENVQKTTVSKINMFCFWVFYGGIYSRFVLIYLLNLRDAGKEIELFKTVDGFDKTLRSLGKSEELREGHRKIFVRAFFVLFFALVTDITTEVFNCLMAYEYVSVATVACHLIASFTGELSKCYFYLWTMIVTDRFKMINEFMLKIKKRSKQKQISVLSVYKFEKDFSQFMDMHKDLTAISRLMNDIFQVQIIWHFAITFIAGFTNAYFCIYTVAHTTAEYENSFWLTVAKFGIFTMFEFVVLINSSYELCTEAARTKEILSYIKLDVQDDISHRLLIASIYELRENKLVITACRLFDIDFSTMFVMSTTITNYVFIMLQFEADSTVTKSSNESMSTTISVNEVI